MHTLSNRRLKRLRPSPRPEKCQEFPARRWLSRLGESGYGERESALWASQVRLRNAAGTLGWRLKTRQEMDLDTADLRSADEKRMS